MRYYRIELTNADTGKPISIPSLAGAGMPPGVITSLMPDGSTNPAALNIEFDITQYPGHQAGGDTTSYIRVWGLSLAELAYSFNLNGQSIKILGGMAKGYPLADPSQAGLLAEGQIYQAFGNWLGVEQTLDISLIGLTKANYTFAWAKGEALSAMIARVLSANMPSATQQINISSQRVANQDKQGVYGTFSQFAAMVQATTKGQLGPNDAGVFMTTNGQTVKVYEGSPSNNTGNVRQIRFQDLIGQPTWARPQQITAKFVLRGDIDVGDTIQFPSNVLVTTQSGARPGGGGTQLGTNPANGMTFGGNARFQIMQIQHWGNFRQPDASSWGTVIWATPITPDGVPSTPAPAGNVTIENISVQRGP